MDLGYVKKIIKLVTESEIDEIEIEEEGKRIRVAKTRNHATPPLATYAVPGASLAPSPAPASVQVEGSGPAQAAPPQKKFHEIKSPIVGTFYRAPAPDAPPFVEVGSTIQSGSALCIVEAMKLMNEIESDVAGRIVKIMVENGQPVEYDQILFLVDQA